MELREHDKIALQFIISTNKSVGGRYYDFEALLECYGRWWQCSEFSVLRASSFIDSKDKFCFIAPEMVFMFIDKTIAKLKVDQANYLNYIAFKLYYLPPKNLEDEKQSLEKILRSKLKYRKCRFYTAYFKAKDKFQEQLRKALLKKIKR